MDESIGILLDRVKKILTDNNLTAYLFGSICSEDFKLGWSDLDILILTEEILSENQAQLLVNLRQELLTEYTGNPYFRSFEGGILSISEFLSNRMERIVYWGTSGQRITDRYSFDVFSLMQLKDSGILLYGKDIRNRISYPSYEEMVAAVRAHYQTIRQYAVKTRRNLYSAGWMLDIARCLYTLSEKKIISKTQAGYWAIEKNLVPNVEVMKRVIEIREKPLEYKDNYDVCNWLETLGPNVQEFANLLENRLGELELECSCDITAGKATNS